MRPFRGRFRLSSNIFYKHVFPPELFADLEIWNEFIIRNAHQLI